MESILDLYFLQWIFAHFIFFFKNYRFPEPFCEHQKFYNIISNLDKTIE